MLDIMKSGVWGWKYADALENSIPSRLKAWLTVLFSCLDPSLRHCGMVISTHNIQLTLSYQWHTAFPAGHRVGKILTEKQDVSCRKMCWGKSVYTFLQLTFVSLVYLIFWLKNCLFMRIRKYKEEHIAFSYLLSVCIKSILSILNSGQLQYG